MPTHQLSRTDARRLAVRAQMLEANRPTELHDLVRGLTLLQIDATNAVAPSADLVAWSRIGSSYAAAELVAALRDRTLLELRGMVRPPEDLALYRTEMAEWPGRGKLKDWQQATRDWVAANDACRRDILDRLTADGPLVAAELPDTCQVPWRSSGWNNDRNVPQLLEMMVRRGEVATAGRQGRDRLWDLASRVYPPITGSLSSEEALARRNERRLQALGIARARGPRCPGEPQDVGEAGEPAVVEGVRGTWRLDPTLLDEPFRGRTALLSPLDRLIYDRKRTTEIFEFDYQLEMFKPAAERKWGYYALPILHGDRLVGKLDAAMDRKAGVLRVNAIHEDVPFTGEMTAAVHDEIEDLARWLEVSSSYAPARRSARPRSARRSAP